jgi:hypothetical protein
MESLSQPMIGIGTKYIPKVQEQHPESEYILFYFEMVLPLQE